MKKVFILLEIVLNLIKRLMYFKSSNDLQVEEDGTIYYYLRIKVTLQSVMKLLGLKRKKLTQIPYLRRIEQDEDICFMIGQYMLIILKLEWRR